MKVFVDTSAWFALADLADKKHQRAVEFMKVAKIKEYEVVTTDYIFDETLTLLRFKLSHAAAIKFGEDLLASQVCRLLEVDRRIRQKAWDIFVKYGDKKFSFTDCTSFAIMNELSIGTAFSFDTHFKQYGFLVLPD
jgi:predicted nucleic acid-binding protein